MSRRVGLIDTTLRDGSQSLWATRMTTAMMLPILPLMDEAGYEAIETYSTVHFDTAVRFLKEDPWERMRLIRERVKRTPIRILGMSQSFSISRVLSDDVVELFNRTCAKNGIDEFWITAALNDTRTAEVSIRTVKSLGLRADGGIQFTESPVHTDEFFANVAREFAAMGVDGIVIKDASGLLTPAEPVRKKTATAQIFLKAAEPFFARVVLGADDGFPHPPMPVISYSEPAERPAFSFARTARRPRSASRRRCHPAADQPKPAVDSGLSRSAARSGASIEGRPVAASNMRLT